MRNRLLAHHFTSFWFLVLFSFPSLWAQEIGDSAQALQVKIIENVVPSPDGSQIALSVREVNADKEWISKIYLKDQAGVIKPLTQGNKATLPRFSPKGNSIAYLNTGKQYQSLWKLDLQTRKAIKLVEMSNDIKTFKWSPDGNSIAFVALGVPENRTMLIDVENIALRERLYYLDLMQNKITPLSPPELSISRYGNPYIDTGFDWSSQGDVIAFSYQKSGSQNDAPKAKIAIVDLISKEITYPSYFEKHVGNQPLYSPNNKWLSFRTEQPKKDDDPPLLASNILYNCRIALMDTTTKETTYLSNTPNECPVMVGWDIESYELIVIDDYATEGTQFYALSQAATKKLSKAEGNISSDSIALNDNRSFIGFSYETFDTPAEAYITPLGTFNLEKVSQIQTTSLTQQSHIQTVQWTSFDGLDIEGLLITPKHFDKSKMHPMLVVIHGGPASVWTKTYFGGLKIYDNAALPLSFKTLIDMGFIVFLPNPRGSSGYGKQFLRANYKDFGGGDYKDILAGINHLIKEGYADPDRLALYGWSYGGYLTAWIISQTDRFKVAVAGAAITDLLSFAGTTDISYYLPQFLGGAFWKNEKLYLDRSPLFYCQDIQTPLLLIHGDADVRVPITQSYELYTALKNQNRPVKMFLMPKQGHFPTNPLMILQVMDETHQWLKKAL